MMEHTYSSDSHQHVDIAIRNNSSPGTSDTHIVLPVTSHLNGDRPSTSTHIPSSEPSLRPPRGLMSRNSSSVVRGGRYGSRSPLNSGLWISVELVVTLGQIIAAIVIMSLSRYESPEAPLFAWVVGYTCGCVATLPILYWRLRHCNRDQHSQSHHGSSGSIRSSETTFTSSSIARGSEEGHHDPGIASRNSHSRGRLSLRLNGMVDHLKITLDCFFAVWFVVGNVWIFGEHTPPSDAPKLYRLCIVFLAFSCIGYALPFVLCSTICCCLPCLISVLGIREDSFPTEGTNVEFIKALPTYKFKLRKTEDTDDQEVHSRTNEGGIIAGGTEKERIISGEDAACCICLATYVDDDELRELPCSHLFHVECVDEWLNVNASCPLCKINVGGSSITTSL